MEQCNRLLIPKDRGLASLGKPSVEHGKAEPGGSDTLPPPLEEGKWGFTRVTGNSFVNL